LTGYSVNQTVLILWSLSLGLALIGLAGFYFNIAESIMFYGFLGLSTLYFYEMQHAWKVMKSTRYHKPKKQGGVSGGLIPR
jgi:UDP-GlcNAc:undecaprenyl-phosphate GlcNAc-1-phosphate transferase